MSLTYVLKQEELKLLTEQLIEVEQKMETLRALVSKYYKEIYCAWCKDIRWLSTRNQRKPIL